MSLDTAAQRLQKIAEGVRLYGAPDKNLLAGRLDAIAETMLADVAAARMEEQSRIVQIMRHVDRLRRHMDEWQHWYGRNDVLMRNQLPLPPSRTAEIMEDLDAAIRAG